MTIIKPFVTEFQVEHMWDTGYTNCVLIPIENEYWIFYENLANWSRNPSIPLLENGDVIVVGDQECAIEHNKNGYTKVVPKESGTTIYNNLNNQLLERYRSSNYLKQKIYHKFIESMQLTDRFKIFLDDNGADLTIISSQTLVLVGVLFYEFAGNRSDLAHQICMDHFHNKYDVAVIVK